MSVTLSHFWWLCQYVDHSTFLLIFSLILKWLNNNVRCVYKRGNYCLARNWKQWCSTLPLFNSVQHLWFLCLAVYWYLGSYLISCLFKEAIYYCPDSPNQRYNTNKVWKRLITIHQPNMSSYTMGRSNYFRSGIEISLTEFLALIQWSIILFRDQI